MATKPNRYVLGAKPELDITPTDLDGVFFVPNESRLSVKQPDGVIVTYSGIDMTVVVSGYLYVLYQPPIVGWYEYEAWVKDGSGREATQTNGFDVIDRVR